MTLASTISLAWRIPLKKPFSFEAPCALITTELNPMSNAPPISDASNDFLNLFNPFLIKSAPIIVKIEDLSSLFKIIPIPLAVPSIVFITMFAVKPSESKIFASVVKSSFGSRFP